jgi:hypothetical protein
MFLLLVFFSWSVSAQSFTNALPALAPAYGELPPTFWEQHQSAILVAGFALLAFAFFILKVTLRPASPVIPPPEVVARQALAKLQRQPEDGNVLSEISQCLRRYVVTALELPIGELTTAEFSAAIAGSEKIGAELAQTIAGFLRECDARKFSPANSATPLNAATRALELVEQAEKRRGLRSAPVPGAATAQAQSASAHQQPHKTSDVAASEDERTP